MKLSLPLKKAILDEATQHWGSGSIHHTRCMSGHIPKDHVCPDGSHPAEKMGDAEVMVYLARALA